MNLTDLIARIRKDAPAVGDTHISNAGGAGKPKRKPKLPDDDESFPVTNMTLAAQAATGQKKPTSKYAEVLKVDDSLGLVLGWAIVCTKGGDPYFDLQDDHIPEDAMLKASADFMQHSRVAKEMHSGEAAGSVVFAFPMTAEIAKAFGVETSTTGLMIAMKPGSDEMLAKFRDGTLTGFSIGGFRLEDEDVA